ncbi:MAG: hypothetical protein KKI06_04705 [Euryarchaeota archaeon]|nr:hypothetical protein [Euryarchaeota archaeon]MBU4222679.1 hypothetical protein [Euryarchaeota archaeon]MCG2737274.1 hypothetical protein [Candidatus Methanoperedenaceae archaeon]
MDKKQFLVEKAYLNDFDRWIDTDGVETEKPELIYFQGVFVSNDKSKKFVDIVKDCWKSKINFQQLFGVILERIKLKSLQRSKIMQSMAKTIFAPFAFFAVRYLCSPNRPQGTNTRGN